MASNGPPLAWPGFRSKVSIWLGPPFIQSRMHDRFRCGLDAASAARVFSHRGRRSNGDASRSQAQPLPTSKFRRSVPAMRVHSHRSAPHSSMVEDKLCAAEQRPEHVARAFLGSTVGPPCST